MLKSYPRIIPVLLLDDEDLIKTKKFTSEKYIGDPINAVKIFNDRYADELIILDITATQKNISPNLSLLKEVASEAFMPVSYGGGITNSSQAESVYKVGIEKVVINSAIFSDISILKDISKIAGSSGVIASIDLKKDFFGKMNIFHSRGKKKHTGNIIDFAKQLEDNGAGEIFINFIDRDSMYSGYDYQFIEKISSELEVPIVCCGGCSSLEDMREALEYGASGMAAGSLFVYSGEEKGILINYPSREQIQKVFND